MNRVEGVVELLKLGGFDTRHLPFYIEIKGEARCLPAEPEKVYHPRPFAPWSDLTDCSELSAALKAAGVIKTYGGGNINGEIYGIAVSTADPDLPRKHYSDTEAEARFRALCLACGVEVE